MDGFLGLVNWGEMIWFSVITMTVHTGVTVLLFLFYEIIERYSLFEDARIQKTPPTKLSRPQLIKCIKLVAVFHFIMQPLGLPFSYLILKQRMGFDGPLPSWTEMVIQIPIFMIIVDTQFYWTHRLLHTPYLYKTIHKIHHRYHYPISLSYEYAHPIENFLTGALPLLTGPFLLKSHIYTFWVWMCIRIIESMDAHSGYDLWFMPFRYFPFRPGAQVHDYHHSHNKGNFAAFFTIWDKLCGTDLSYVAYNEVITIKKK